MTEFFEVISESAPHIYHSALPLAPESSIIRKLYGQQISAAARVVAGIPSSWDLCTAIAGATSEPGHAIWSPCGQYIAAGLEKDIEIRDSTTLEMSRVLRPPDFENFNPNFLAFSPGGRLLIRAYEKTRSGLLFSFASILTSIPSEVIDCTGNTLASFSFLLISILTSMSSPRVWRHGKLVAWDIQTGIVVEELQVKLDSGSIQRRALEFAGRVHTLRDGTFNAIALEGGEEVGPHWTHEGSLYFATTLYTGDNYAIRIREFQPTSTPSYPVIKEFQVAYPGGEFSFSPTSFHASFVTERKVVILDVRDSNTLLHTEAIQTSYHYSPGLFSPNGCFFACETLRRDIAVWKNSPDGYIPWSTVPPRLPCEGFSFSPTATSILTWGSDGIQLLRPDNRVSPPAPDTTEPNRDNHLVTSSIDGKRIATTRYGGRVIIILDSALGTKRHSIDVGSGIQDMRLVSNAILVLGEHRLARWNFETDGGKEVEVDSGILTDLGPVRHLALSNDGARIACIRNKLLMYDLKSQRIIGSHVVQTIRSGVEGVRFSPCGSKLWFWSVVSDHRPGYTFGYLFQVDIEGGHFASSRVHGLEDGWSLLALFQSRDGFRIGRGGRWVEDSGGRKLFWLPPNWRVKDARHVIWEGNLLAFVDGRHREPIIIHFQP